MAIQVTSGITVFGVAAQVLRYCQINHTALALGGGVPWLYPFIPPPVNIFLTELPTTLGYFPVKRIVPIVKNSNGDVPINESESWQTLPLTLEAIAEAGCRHALIEAEIVHNSLPSEVLTYQSVGVYLDTSAPTPVGFHVGNPSGYLDVIQHFGLLYKVSDTTHVVRIIREF